MYPVTMANPEGGVSRGGASPPAYSMLCLWKNTTTTASQILFLKTFYCTMIGKLLQLKAIFFTQNALKTVWRPGSARAYRGACSAPPDPWLDLRGRFAAEKGSQEKDRKGRERRDHSPRPMPVSATAPWYIAAIVFRVNKRLEIARENCFATQWHMSKLRNGVFTFLCRVS